MHHGLDVGPDRDRVKRPSLDALAQSAKRLPDLFVLFRRHYNERSHETENVLRSADAFRLAVSDEPDLMSDVAGSDQVRQERTGKDSGPGFLP